MNMNHHMNMNPNPHAMMDQVKSMVLTMVMMKTTTQPDSLVHSMLLMVVVSCLDVLMAMVRNACTSVYAHVMQQVTTVVPTPSMSEETQVEESSSSSKKKKKEDRTACILYRLTESKDAGSSEMKTVEALMDALSLLPHAGTVMYKHGSYVVHHNNELEIIPHRVFAALTVTKGVEDTNKEEEKTKEKEKTKEGEEFTRMEVYSYTLPMDALREEVTHIVHAYLVKMNNKLGNQLYYFNEFPYQVYRDQQGMIDYTKAPKELCFTMHKFVTNRSFRNVFGEDIDVIRRRVEYFRDNRAWYDDQGIPYSLGIMASGLPGTGKTSVIKCIANDLKRHIVNVHLSDTMTKTQLERLFYSDELSVISRTGKTEMYSIPIDRRLYVIEDIDCQCDMVLDRATTTTTTEPPTLTSVLQKERDQNQKITLSFFLNLMDGILETPGRVMYMTTNFRDKLDKAFTRPGRVDVMRHFGNSTAYQMEQLITHRYGITLSDAQRDVLISIDRSTTTAEVSRILFENMDTVDRALEELVLFCRAQPAVVT